jgi:hypothetical protein
VEEQVGVGVGMGEINRDDSVGILSENINSYGFDI